MQNEFKDKTIMVTGGTGSIGSIIVKQLLKYEPKQIRVFSRDDTKQYYLQEKLNRPKCLRLFIGDVRDKKRLNLAMKNVDIVFHAAALKHVSLAEYNPFEAVQTNVIGSQNVIESALENKVNKVIAVSTDKAVNPINAMGTTKLLMEKLFIGANYYKGELPTKFSCVRFGNVVWARGSVLPLWYAGAKKNQEIKLTEPKMTRFLMSINQAAKLVLKASTLTLGGEIFVLKMPSIKMQNLADMFISAYFPSAKIKVKIIGARPGEKMHEALFNEEENYKHIFENDDMFIVVPDLRIFGLEMEEHSYKNFKRIEKINKCSSENYIDNENIKKII